MSVEYCNLCNYSSTAQLAPKLWWHLCSTDILGSGIAQFHLLALAAPLRADS